MSLDSLTYKADAPPETASRTLPPWQEIWFRGAVEYVMKGGIRPDYIMQYITDTLPGAMINSAPEHREETERILAPLLADFRDQMRLLMPPTKPALVPLTSYRGPRLIISLPLLVGHP